MTATTAVPAKPRTKPAKRRKAAAPERSRDRGDGCYVAVHRGLPAILPLSAMHRQLTLGDKARKLHYSAADRSFAERQPEYENHPHQKHLRIVGYLAEGLDALDLDQFGTILGFADDETVVGPVAEIAALRELVEAASSALSDALDIIQKVVPPDRVLEGTDII